MLTSTKKVNSLGTLEENQTWPPLEQPDLLDGCTAAALYWEWLLSTDMHELTVCMSVYVLQ